MTVHDVAKFLNEVHALDPIATQRLVVYRVPARKEVREHVAIQVDDSGRVGIIGLLNGMLARDNHELRLAAKFDDFGLVTSFVVAKYNGQEFVEYVE